MTARNLRDAAAAVVLETRMNRANWSPDTLVCRDAHLVRDHVVCGLTLPRRTGKTTLLVEMPEIMGGPILCLFPNPRMSRQFADTLYEHGKSLGNFMIVGGEPPSVFPRSSQSRCIGTVIDEVHMFEPEVLDAWYETMVPMAVVDKRFVVFTIGTHCHVHTKQHRDCGIRLRRGDARVPWAQSTGEPWSPEILP